MYSDRDSYQKSVRRAREERWRVRGRARVVHPKYGGCGGAAPVELLRTAERGGILGL